MNGDTCITLTDVRLFAVIGFITCGAYDARSYTLVLQHSVVLYN